LNKLIVKKAAVLGAGVMGAQIAAHLANANVPVVLFDLPAKEGDKNGIVKKALDGLKKLDPAPLASKSKLKFIDAANYDEHLPLLAECDLIIEAIAERMDWKNDLYAKIAPHIAPNAIVASNTSGLSMNALAQGCRSRSGRASAASTSSTRRATCIWSRSSAPRRPMAARWMRWKPG
jgi:3-hydroxyacyl-CoA dehydrogenase